MKKTIKDWFLFLLVLIIVLVIAGGMMWFILYVLLNSFTYQQGM